VYFQPATGGRGTVVRVEIEYKPPGGAIGRTIAQLFGNEPAQQVKGDLNRFKQVIETGEVVVSEGTPKGLGEKFPYPAQPAGSKEQGKQGKNLLGKLLPGKLFSGDDEPEQREKRTSVRDSERNRLH
jgi:hypothetical protein